VGKNERIIFNNLLQENKMKKLLITFSIVSLSVLSIQSKATTAGIDIFAGGVIAFATYVTFEKYLYQDECLTDKNPFVKRESKNSNYFYYEQKELCK